MVNMVSYSLVLSLDIQVILYSFMRIHKLLKNGFLRII